MNDAYIKAAVRERDGFRCIDCQMTRESHIARYGQNLDVHRLVVGEPYELAGCVTLCRPCHKKRHRRPRTVESKIDAEVLRIARIVAAYENVTLAEVISEAARLPLEKKLEQHQSKKKPRDA